MEELLQLSSFFVANLYLEKVELGGSHGGDFTWRGDYCIYQKPYVAWFQLNQMINSYLFEDWKENNFFMLLHFYSCKDLFILCTQYFPTHAGSLRFILEESWFDWPGPKYSFFIIEFVPDTWFSVFGWQFSNLPIVAELERGHVCRWNV